jgi:hypothetical protein
MAIPNIAPSLYQGNPAERFAQYDRLKAEWKAANPNATPSQYTAAMIVLAKKAGV